MLEKREMTNGTTSRKGLIVGIDASRNRSGGAVAHIKGILSGTDIQDHGIEKVYLWSHKNLLDQIPDYSWLEKVSTVQLDKSMIHQLWWQAVCLKNELSRFGCDILFTVGASTLCRFSPQVVLSQDMMSYEPGVMEYYGFGKTRLRLELILQLQNLAFRRAEGVIFLTKYAGTVIQGACGRLKNVEYIPHGISENFLLQQKEYLTSFSNESSISAVYVSQADLYKHQWEVVKAIAQLRKKGINISLMLIGGGSGKAKQLLDTQIKESDPECSFVRQVSFLPNDEIPERLVSSDIFIFASSCENMPITLLEGMAVGLPIACSSRGPMPEVLGDAGVYFDPVDSNSISSAIEQLVKNPVLMKNTAMKAKQVASEYTWAKCAERTWSFIVKTYSGCCDNKA
ncbi:MAG: glycosyltransferase family 4 protein [Agarilytica sp.]